MPDEFAIAARLEEARKRLIGEPLDLGLTDSAELGRIADLLDPSRDLLVSGPTVSPNALALQSTDSPYTIQQTEQEKEQRSFLMKGLEFLAEASGIPSIFRVAVTALPEGAESSVRERTGVGKATTGDYLVAGITLLGGFGVKGALSLIRGAVGTATRPAVEAAPSVLRAAIKQLSRAEVKEAIEAGAVVSAEHVPARLTMEEMRGAVNAVIEAVRMGEPVSLDPAVGRLFKQIGRAYEVGDVEVDVIPRLMADLGIDATSEGRVAFARMFESAFSEWGRTGKAISDLRKQLGKVLTQDELLAAGLKDVEAAGTVYRVMRGSVNLWRASITSQLSTAMRNFEVGLIRMPLKFFEDVASASVAKFTGQTGGRASFAPAFENLTALWRGAKPTTRESIKKLLLRIDESENKLVGGLWGKFFQTPATEVVGTGVKGGARKVLNFMQMANRTQENLMRSIAFDAQLGKRLAQMGVAYDDVFRLGPQAFGNKWKAIRQAVEESVNEALEVTFALRPSGKLWNHLFKVYEEFPAAALIHPFPRFFANSIKFFKDHSPFGLMRFATQSQRNAITRAMKAKGFSGDFVQREATEALGKVMSGHMMLSAAVAWRNSDMAGDRWYEIRLPGGKVVDTRPFNPLAAYMLLAERMRQIADPASPRVELKTRDFAEAFAGIRRFTGTGLFVFNLFDSDLGTFEKGVERTAGELVGGFTIPFRTVKDFMATAIPDEAVYRAKDVGGILGPAISNLPLLGMTTQPAEPRAERAGELGKEPRIGGLAPATLRQLTGLAPRERTTVESELIKHDVSTRPRTGDPELNRRIMQETGPEIDKRLNKIIQSPTYKRMNSVEQRERLSKEIQRIRSRAKKQVFRSARGDIVAKIVNELKDRDRETQLRQLRRMRNAGRINKRLEQTIAARLRLAR